MQKLLIVSDVSEEQIKACVDRITNITSVETDKTLRKLADKGVLTRRNMERVLEHVDEVAADITRVAEKRITRVAGNIVRLISGDENLEIEATDGKATIAEAKDTFASGIHGLTYKTRTSLSTRKTNTSVHEMIDNGTFPEIFGGMTDDLNSLLFTEPQIIQFVQKYRRWLRTDGYATFFLFKVGDEFLVACVYVYNSGKLGTPRTLGVRIDSLQHSRIWRAEDGYRVVVPKPALTSQS